MNVLLVFQVWQYWPVKKYVLLQQFTAMRDAISLVLIISFFLSFFLSFFPVLPWLRARDNHINDNDWLR